MAECWYAVHSQAQKEPVAARELRRLGYQTFFPHTTEWVGSGHKAESRLVRRPWFSRYLFVRALRGNLWAVNQAAGVSSLVYAAGQDPFPIPDLVMDALMQQADHTGEIFITKTRQRSRFRKSQIIRLLDENSPLFGLYVSVVRTLDNGNVIGLLENSILAGTGTVVLTAPVIGEVVERTA